MDYRIVTNYLVPMAKKILFFLCLFAGYQVMAQEDETAAVTKAVQQMFDGMRKGDSAMVSSVFHPKVSFASSFSREGVADVRFSQPQAFLKAVGTPHDKVWDERISDLKITIDDNLAVAWMKYAFYLGGEFSHCGVNAFTLGKTSEGWKIIFVSDTRRRTGCEAYGKE